MHGPYIARIRQENVSAADALELSTEDLEAGERIACRFYRDASPGLVEGCLRSAVFAAGAMLVAGEGCTVEIYGREGTEGSSRKCPASVYGGDHRYCSRCGGTGRETARDILCRSARVYRDGFGRLYSTLGSRFGERIFQGV